MAEPKTRPTDESVQDFLARVSDEKKRQDCARIAQMMQTITGVAPVIWGLSIVGFGRYQYTYASGREGEWPIIGFSPRKSDLTVYIMPGFDQYKDLTDKLGKFKTGKSCLYIKRLEDVDFQVLSELVQRSVSDMASKRVDV